MVHDGHTRAAFLTAANLTVAQCINPTVRITKPEFEPNLQEGEFLVILNLYSHQSAVIEQATSAFSDDEACDYVRSETNKAIAEMAQSGSTQVATSKGVFGQAVPSVCIDRVLWLPEDTGRRRFIGVGKGTVVTN